ncbi:TPA: hypothetical protein ACM7GQ_003562 [Escherichia coli]
MQISAETRAVLRHYRQIINARRREARDLFMELDFVDGHVFHR